MNRNWQSDLQQLHALMSDSSLYLPFTPFSAVIEGAKTAEQMLTGAIYQREMKYAEAIKAFSAAVETPFFSDCALDLALGRHETPFATQRRSLDEMARSFALRHFPTFQDDRIRLLE